uniref:Protein CUSTOS n=1 Tax=Nothoprocta perdicaria TaxID=30464 RepID=A0A8C6ZAC2_NOTPE
MAARRGGPSSESSSESSDEAAAARFREAAWDCGGWAGGAARIFLLLPHRRDVNGHSEDGNELQTTPEFRAHVARKLGAMLDRYRHAMPRARSGGEAALVLLPSEHGEVPEPCPARRRRPSSSSDSDSDEEWQRYQEAAVSGTDILKQSALPALCQEPSEDLNHSCAEPSQKKKKKKKKKGEKNIKDTIEDVEECDQIRKDLRCLVSTNGQDERHDRNIRETAVLPEGVKKKKKRKKELRFCSANGR